MSDHEERLKNLETSLEGLKKCFEELLKSHQHLLLAVLDIRFGQLSASVAKERGENPITRVAYECE